MVMMFMAVVMIMAMVMMVVMVVVMMVLVIMVVMIQGFLFLPVHRHLHMRPGNAAFFRRLRLNPHARKPQRVHFFQENASVRQKLRQRRHQHIPRGPHAALQIQCFHTVFLLCEWW